MTSHFKAAFRRTWAALARRRSGGRPPARPRWREILEILVWVAAITFVVRGLLVGAHRVRSQSMLPGIRVGDRVVTKRCAFSVKIPLTRIDLLKRRLPRHGELVVFVDPKGGHDAYVKRVVGLPGDRIRLDGQRVFVNGRELVRRPIGETEYVDPFARAWKTQIFEERNPDGTSYRVMYDRKDTARSLVKCTYCGREFTVGAGLLFVMGDNRDDSVDSRHWGMVPESLLLGKPWFVAFSADAAALHWDRIGAGLD